MATALVAHLGFRPALAAPGRSCWFAGQPLCKPTLRRLAAAQPAPAPPPNQPQGQLQGAAPQTAPGAEPVSTKRLLSTLILALAVGGFIFGPVSPLYWFNFGMFVCLALMCASVEPREPQLKRILRSLAAAQQPAPGAEPVSTKRLLSTLILALAVGGFIFGPVSPLYWVNFGLFVCLSLLAILRER